MFTIHIKNFACVVMQLSDGHWPVLRTNAPNHHKVHLLYMHVDTPHLQATSYISGTCSPLLNSHNVG